MTDFLLELRSEEIPARMQEKAREDLARLFAAELAAAGLAAEETVTYATPRRLALIARGLPEQTAAVSEEIKGPRVGAPPQALEGFLRKTGLSQDQLVERDGVLFAVIDKPGRATAEVLAAAIPAVIRAFPWPKSMRWGEASISTESQRWVRPLQGIVAIFGEALVECEVAGIRSDYATVGHRFHHPGAITIGGAGDYVEKLRACHVIVDGAERRATIALGSKLAAQKAGLVLVEDEGLLFENAGLTEFPVPLLGRFDEAFLDVPPEVIQLTARVNQKYFVCRDAAGKLANAFVCVANIDAEDGGAKIVEGNRKVLAARLSDARFFWEEDQYVYEDAQRTKIARRKTLDELNPKLKKIVFHEKLGTVAERVDRITKLALWLVETDVVKPREATPQAKTELYNNVRNAASHCKSDLVTGMVGEFPELQGLMGGYYAKAQGEPIEVAEAIRDHYKPVGQGDDVPAAPATVAVSLADKLDVLAAFFAIDEKPTGSKDPFALRRSAIACINLIVENGLRVTLKPVLGLAMLSAWLSGQPDTNLELAKVYEALASSRSDRAIDPALADQLLQTYVDSSNLQLSEARPKLTQSASDLVDFFADRLKVQQREAGVRHDLIDAVFALGGEDDLVRLLARVHALQSFVGTEDGANLLTGYRRAANILKKEEYEPGVTNPSPEPAEAALIAALDAAEPRAAAAVEAEDFEGAMAALATLRGPIDAFFDQVTVNDADATKRAARLGLLARMRDAVHRVADFSRIEG